MSRRDDPERGLTMVELIIGMAMGTVVAALAVYMFATTIKTQGVVTASTTGATQGQVISELLDKAVRNAQAVKVSGDRLDLRAAGASGGCQAFAVVTNADGTAELHERNAGIDQKIASAPSEWPVFAVGVSRYTPFGSASPSDYFAPTGSSGVDYSFVLQGANGPVDIVSSAYQRVPGGSISPCA